jgi:uridine monophosphate synthetase
MGFYTKLRTAVEHNHSLLCVGLDPVPAQAPGRYADSAGDPVATSLAWNRAIIEQTHDLVCAYKPNIAFYEALGAAGMAMLRQTIDLIPPAIPILLDAKRGDIGSTAEAYARACFDDLKVDGVTLSPYLGRDSVEPFMRYADKGLFVLCHTSNPSAAEFQELEIADWRSLDREPNHPLYVRVARAATQWSSNVGLVVGATYPDAMANVRAVAPDAWFLVPGIGAQGGDLVATLAAGLRADGLGLIINASRTIALADDHRAAARQFRDEINAARSTGPRPLARPAPPAPARQTSGTPSLAVDLFHLGAVKFGTFTLASGMQSPIYIDLRLLVSQPVLLARAAAAYAAILAELPCERIAGVPYAALPIGTAVAIEANTPLIYPRKEAKAHGLGKLIEGAWQPGDRVVIIEDLITSGGSTRETAEALRAAGMIVEHTIVLIDREQGGVDNLAQAGITAHSVFKLTDMLDDLVAHQLLEESKRQEVLAFLSQSRA